MALHSDRAAVISQKLIGTWSVKTFDIRFFSVGAAKNAATSETKLVAEEECG